MRMAELSRRTGVPVPTIKYYLREGLLLPGERTSPNQAFYDESHIRRLRMIRALAEVGGMSIAKVREVLAAVDSTEPPFQVMGKVQHSIEPPQADGAGEHWQAARKQAEKVLEDRGWFSDADSPAGRTLVAALASLYELDRDDLVGMLERYAEIAELIAVEDVANVIGDRGMEDVVEGMVIGTVLGEKMFSALRRLAHQHVTAKALGIHSGDRE